MKFDIKEDWDGDSDGSRGSDDDLYSPGGSISDEDLEKRNDRTVEVFETNSDGGAQKPKRKLFDDENDPEGFGNVDDDKSITSSSMNTTPSE